MTTRWTILAAFLAGAAFSGPARAADDTNREIAVSFADFHVRSRDFGAADRSLSDHLRRDASDARAWNMLGLVRIRANRPAQAAEAFARAVAVRNHPSRGVFLYNQADALARAGDEPGARRALEEASKDATVGESARDALDELRAGQPLPGLSLSAPAGWDADVALSTGYDSNVLLFSESALAASSTTGTASPFLSVSPRVTRSTGAFGGRLDATGAAGFTAQTGSEASEFNSLTASAGTRWAPSRSGGFGQAYSARFDYNLLNSDGLQFFAWNALAGWKGTWAHSNFETRLEIPLRYQRFRRDVAAAAADERSGFAAGPAIGHRRRFGKVELDAALQFEKVFARGENFRSMALRAPLEATGPFFRSMTWSLGVEWARVLYPDSSGSRGDTYLQGSAGLSRKFGEKLTGSFGYSYTKNDSNSVTAAYSKHLAAITVTYDLL